MFAHLHVHSEYSLLDGAIRVRDLPRRAAEMGMDAVALTDHGVMYGIVDFYKACLSEGVRPVLGCEVYVAPRTRKDREPGIDDDIHHLVLLAENPDGYRNLVRLVSEAFIDGLYYKPRADYELLERNHEGLIALSGCLAGKIPRLILAGDRDGALQEARRMKELFGPDRFYLEIMNHGLPEQAAVNAALAGIGQKLGLDLVATNDAHYLRREDFEAHDALLCIQTASQLSDPDRLRFPNDEFYLKSEEEMRRAFRDYPGAVDRAAEIAARCRVDLEFGKINLPVYDLPRDHDEASFLTELCQKGLSERYGEPSPEVLKRMDYELSIIEKMGYAGYFLIVWDFVSYAKSRGIPVGPGRGSAAGSLVAYLLGITDLDPLKYGLLFERFLNPERVTMPDMDIDFCYERRGEVIDYVVKKYGSSNVAQIITFGTMAARAAVRDVGRALGWPYADVDRLAKMVPAELGVTLEKALAESTDLHRVYREDERARKLIDLARAVEGLPRHASVHAAGVVISGRPLKEQVPLQVTSDGSVVTQYPMNVLEDLGLLKMDFLGLRTLTVIDKAERHIRRKVPDFDINKVPLDDRGTYELLSSGKAVGVFQLESDWVRDMLTKLKPRVFEDIVAAVALCRPGPMENIPEYVRAKEKGASYLHPDLEPILKDTYGVMVYQEQIMQVASTMAGFSLGQADVLRRAIGKKKAEVLAEQREAFVKGCLGQGYDKDLAAELYDTIVKFANYGFNRAHSAAYGLLAYRTAYLKANYPAAFWASLLTSVSDSTDKLSDYIREARGMKLEVLPPDVNRSGTEFVPEGERGIRYSLAAVKNVGRSAVEALVREREENGPYKSLEDLLMRLDPHQFNRRALEALIKAGAFDSTGHSRAGLLLVLDAVIERAGQRKRESESDQFSLFELLEDEFPVEEVQVPEEEWPPSRMLAMEKEALGLYLTAHPLDGLRDLPGFSALDTVADLQRRSDGDRVAVGGIAVGLKSIVTKKGDNMGFMTLEDLSGQVEVVLFPSVYERARGLLAQEVPLLVSGRVSTTEEGVKVLGDSMMNLPEYLRGKRLIVDLRGQDAARMKELKRILDSSPGPTRVFLRLSRGRYLAPSGGIDASPETVRSIENLVGPENLAWEKEKEFAATQ